MLVLKRVLKNSMANLINGMATTLMGIGITPFLLDSLTNYEFTIWQLSLQIGLLFALLGMGSQTAVGRFVSLHLHDRVKKGNVITFSLYLVGAAFLFGLIILGVLHFNYDLVIDNFDTSSVDYSLSISLIILSYLINIFSFVFIGYFIGHEKNEIPMLVNVGSKLLTAFSVVVIAANHDFIWATITMLISAIITVLVLFILFLRHFRGNLSFKLAFGNDFFSYTRFSLSLGVMGLASYIVSNSATLFLAKYDFSAVAPYTIAATLVTALVGVSGALINPMIQPLTRYYSEGEHQKITSLMIKLIWAILAYASVLSGFILLLGDYFFEFYLGTHTNNLVKTLFTMLSIVSLFRLVGMAFFVVLISQGRTKETLVYPILEAIIYIISLLAFLKIYGVIGIVYSICFSGIVILSVYSLYLINKVLVIKIHCLYLASVTIGLPSAIIALIFMNIN
ncbi:MAG: oligosaccharide flippase family protein [Psychrobium sp.]